MDLRCPLPTPEELADNLSEILHELERNTALRMVAVVPVQYLGAGFTTVRGSGSSARAATVSSLGAK
jgi:hypothetical protein